MSRFDYTEDERVINAVLKSQRKALDSIQFSAEEIDDRIDASEALLVKLGYSLPDRNSLSVDSDNTIVIPSWSDVSENAMATVGLDCELESLFTAEELEANFKAIRNFNADYNQIHRLDHIDIEICAAAGLIAGLVDILLVGIPAKTKGGLEVGPLSDFVRGYFEKAFPKEEMERLASSPMSKVPYDAQDNRHTQTKIEGLSACYHRLLSIGHDPILGLLFGTVDIINGTMTTIDKQGNVVVQVMKNYAERKESDIFSALAKQLRHFASDVNTSMGLPAPFMGLFNLIQAGSFGEYEQTVAEIVQGMYFEGYDFVHFCSTSIPAMLAEVVVRVGYAMRRLNEGKRLKDALPLTMDRTKNPKLGTMLFVAHSSAAAINAGKVYFSKNPMAINYAQWLAFSKQLFQQCRWALLEKQDLRDKFVMGKIDEELDDVFARIDRSFLLLD